MTSWRAVPGYPGYEVSDTGSVRSLDRIVRNRWGLHTRKGVELSQGSRPEGYRVVWLYDGAGKRTTLGVHVLVAAAFMEGSGEVVRHWDGNPANNHVSNLRYGTHADNAADKVRHGRHNMARKTECKHGHPFTEENTYHTPGGARVCRECNRARNRAWRASGQQGLA